VNNFKKTERVKEYGLIKELLKFKNSFKSDSFIISYIFGNKNKINKNKILISVPKKNIKNAVDRNRIKRLIRESYRLQKSITNKIILHNKNLAILLVYSSSKTNVTFKEIFDKINLILQSLKKKQNEKN
tara:strand:+ start:62 stop:448 length:387 start_codon:yes stop_codon:yes gene_type:complete